MNKKPAQQTRADAADQRNGSEQREFFQLSARYVIGQGAERTDLLEDAHALLDSGTCALQAALDDGATDGVNKHLAGLLWGALYMLQMSKAALLQGMAGRSPDIAAATGRGQS